MSSHFDIVGSFLRPAALKQARLQFEQGNLDQADLTKVEDQLITELVKQEVAAGLTVVTDGEFRRSYWHLDTFWGFGGIDHTQAAHGYFFHDEETRRDAATVTGPIHFTGQHPDLAAFEFLKSVTPAGITPRQSIPSPAQCYFELIRDQENVEALQAVYPNETDLLTDLIQAYRDLIQALYQAGCRDLKLDDCTWGTLVDEDFWQGPGKELFDRTELQAKFLALDNAVLAGWPSDLRLSTHVCRGNYHSTWASAGGYGAVADDLFGKLNVDAYYLEFDDDRSGDFAPLAKVTGDKTVVLGLVTSKQATLEDPTTLIQRVTEASQYVPLERLALSTQCGFASTEEGNQLTATDQWNKIKLVVETAKQIWSTEE
ncbi:5-methyltetrahydropteroyltriglutamate--homocysteine S-methyltransferase [Limosilactobacillus equigenerosi]|uniref:Methionine synthase n=1 Tax=Limosilactobacillus equigenerosi DSM 18793 = JCM 14505 TaxID=1423742 RepID=A0A0R1UR21_9LACO|nr:5-methyltetrahydropteroyltriglutamate--homocysteine S-methyltransferase [Limosilactobacillus equigenerosi]KRL95649.1 Methionine synthase [Limosilactobacillus equigenerosi DSM 18793 = JCM 14505]